jgi:hypothetical protein
MVRVIVNQIEAERVKENVFIPLLIINGKQEI